MLVGERMTPNPILAKYAQWASSWEPSFSWKPGMCGGFPAPSTWPPTAAAPRAYMPRGARFTTDRCAKMSTDT
jgi:hypothetical protein